MPNKSYHNTQRQAADMFAWLLMSSIPAGVLSRLGLEAYRSATKPPKTSPVAGYKSELSLPKYQEEKEASVKAANFIKDIHKKLSDAVYNTFVEGKENTWFAGGGRKSPFGIPWTYGIGLPAGVATGVGAWTGTSKLIKHLRNRESQSERDAAKEEYDRLIQLAVQSTKPKDASALESLAELRTKSATFDNPWYTWSGAKERGGEYSGRGAGILLALFLLSAGLGGKHMWKKTTARTDADLVSEAQRIRSLQHMHGPGVPMHIPHTEEKDNQ